MFWVKKKSNFGSIDGRDSTTGLGVRMWSCSWLNSAAAVLDEWRPDVAGFCLRRTFRVSTASARAPVTTVVRLSAAILLCVCVCVEPFWAAKTTNVNQTEVWGPVTPEDSDWSLSIVESTFSTLLGPLWSLCVCFTPSSSSSWHFVLRIVHL